MKLAVLTGGSDVPGLNAVIRAVVRTAVLRYQDDVVGVSQGWEGLLDPPEIWTLSIADMRGLGRRGGTFLGSCNRGTPFAADGVDRSHEVLDTARWQGIEGVICVGGDGSLAIARRLHAKGLPVIGIPKTIANDMGGTSLTFGYATAVEIATEAIDKLQTTQELNHRVMYLEVMGRQAGWIAVQAGVAGGADVILIPELPFRPERVAEVIERRRGERKHCTVVVVAEGAREADETPEAWAERVRLHGSTAVAVARRVAERCAADHRVTVLGHLQRGGDPTAPDRILATRFGAAAVQAAHEGRFGQMVALQGDEITCVPLSAAEQPRLIALDSETIGTARAVGTSFGD